VALGGIGSEVSKLALPLLVLDQTHSLGAAALLRVLQSAPYVVFGAFAGALIDRMDKRRLLIGCDVFTAALMASIPLSVSFGFFSLELVYALSFLLGTVELVFGVTTDFSVVPALVEERELTSANAAYLGADRAARIVGPTLAGLAISFFGGDVAGDAGALWLAVIAVLPTIVVFLRMPPVYNAGRIERALTVDHLAEEIGEGFTFIWRHAVLRALLVLMFVSNLGGAGIQTIVLFVLRQEYGLDPATIGVALSISGAIQLAGSFAAPPLARGRPLGQTILGVMTFVSLSSAAAALASDWRHVLAAFTARQTAWAAHIVYMFLPRQREVPVALRGRVNASFRTLVLISNTASPALLSTVQSVAGSPAAFATAGALGVLAALITYFSPLRRYDIRETEEALAEIEPAAESEPAPAD
jgi:MFS family permease